MTVNQNLTISKLTALWSWSLYTCGKNLDFISNKLEMETMFHSKYKNLENNMIFSGSIIKSLDTVELLGVKLYRNINFKR